MTRSLLPIYSATACIALLVLGGHCLLYEEWLLPPQPALEQRWVGETPFRIEPKQSVAVAYTVTCNWSYGVIKSMPNATDLAIQDRRAPANTFEVRECDLGYCDTTPVVYVDGSWIYDENAAFAVKVCSPSGEVLNEDEGAHGRGWSIEEPGTYRIVIASLSPSQPLEIIGVFEFARNRFYRPYVRLGYMTFSLGIGFIIVELIGKLRGRARGKVTVPYHIFDRSI